MIKPYNRALGAKGKHANRAGARWKCTPSAYGTSPGGGGLLSAFLSANLSSSLYSAAKSSPFGGKVVRQHQKGCISLAPKARLYGFPFARKGGLLVFPRPKGGYMVLLVH